MQAFQRHSACSQPVITHLIKTAHRKVKILSNAILLIRLFLMPYVHQLFFLVKISTLLPHEMLSLNRHPVSSTSTAAEWHQGAGCKYNKQVPALMTQ